MYVFRYYDENEDLVVEKFFDYKPTESSLVDFIYNVDISYQKYSLEELLVCDGEYVEFVGEDDDGYQEALYYAQLLEVGE